MTPRTHNEPVYLRQLTEAQRLRAEGRTRKAEVEGKTVRFMRLSKESRVVPSWQRFWTGHYESRAETLEAARRWEAGLQIEQYGFWRQS